jgi:hypothetical protein
MQPWQPFQQQRDELGGVVKQSDRSWLSLLVFFAVITLGSSLIFAVVFAGVTAAIAGGESAQAAEDQQVDPIVPGQTFSGLITDAHCGSRHTDSKNSASECARMCVRNGSRYVMVDGDRNYEITGTPGQFGQLAGQRVSLTGVLSGGAIKVSSARPQAVKVGE